MLAWSQRHWRNIILLVAIWFAFECLISWAAFCNDVNYQAHSGEKYYCVLRGPGASIIRFIHEWWSHIFHEPDAYVALFTAVLALFTLALWRSTRNLWIATRETANRQKCDTEILQRAYIAVAPRGIHLLYQGDKLIGHVSIINAGNLPARNVSWFIGIKISASGNEAHFPLKSGAGNIVISPRAEAERGSSEYVVLQDVLTAAGNTPDKTKQNPVFLYVWGIVEYHDGFTSPRTTKFCHRYNWINSGRSGAPYYEIYAQYARYHEYGNDAD